MTGLLATAVGTAITLGFAFGATFLAQKLLGAPDDADMGDSPTYSFGNIQNTTRNGQPIAVTYGEHKVGGEIINVFTTSDEQGNSSLRLLIGMGEGTIESIAGLTSDFNNLENGSIPDGIKINGNEANILDGVKVSGRLGSDGQSIIPGFRDLVTVITLNIDLVIFVEVQQVTSGAVDAFEVVLFWPNGLYKIDKHDGDIDHESAFYRVRWRRQGDVGDQEDVTIEVRKRTTSPFTVTYRTDKPFEVFGQAVICEVDVTMLSGNDDERHKLEFDWQSLNEIDINGGLKYQHTALLGLEIPAQEAVNNTVPSVTVIVEGKQVFIWNGVDPDPETATYTFAYSSNPAWCAMDLILNKRYGGGDRFDACSIDLVSFKEWADYCDELIPDTIGGDMKRWELGLVLDEAEPFWDQVLRICACGRATILKDGNIFRVKIERPSDPVQLFTSGNMKVGTLVIQYASNQDRANVVEVQYLDAANEYENSIAGREDETALEQVGDPVRKESVQLYGITKQARAYRAAQYLLNINSRWLTTVEFEAPVDAIAAEPGDVILVSHDIWSQLSGRIHTTSATSTQVVIDRDLTITAGQTWKITVRTSALGSDSLQERTIVSSPGTYLTGSILTVNVPWTGGDLPQKYDLYGLGNTAIQPHVKLYRMVSSELRPDLTRHIAALEYDETVYDDDPGTIIEDPSDPPITPDTIPPIGTSLTLLEGGGPSINASWVKASWPFAYQSQVYLRNETDGATTFVLVGTTFESTFIITDGVFLSNFYTVSIVPMAPNGQHGPPENGLIGTILISGNTGFPDPVTDLTCSQQGRNVTLQWTGVAPADNNLSHYEIRRGLEWIHGHQIGTTTAVMFTTTDWPVGLETFIVRTVSNAGKLDLNPDRHECLLVTPVPEVSVINRDEVALGWPGTKTNLTVDGDGTLRISDTFLTGTYESPALDGAIIQSFRAGILIGSRQEDNAFTWDSGSTLWTDATYTWDSGTAGSTTWDSASITWDSIEAKIRDWTGLYYPPTNTTQTLEWKFSDDDITYSAYSPAIPGDYSFRYLKFRITLTRDHVTNRQARVSILLTTASHATDAPADATYVVMSLNGTLTDERVLTAGEGIDITDGGAGGNVTEKVLFTPGELLRLRDSDNSHATTFGTGNQAVDIDYTLPIAGPSVNGQVLSGTTGNVLSWVTPSAGSTLIVQEDDVTVDAAATTLDFLEPLATIVTSGPAGEANVDLSQYMLASGARPAAGNIDLANFLLLNIGAAGTDFTAGGGLTLASTLTLTGFTTGSVLFIGAAAAVSQDNANLFWDDSNNRLSVGSTENSITISGGGEGIRLALHMDDPGDEYVFGLHQHNSSAGLGAHAIFARSRGTEASETVVSSGDTIGEIQFAGHDGTDYALGAILRVAVDNTPGAGDMPSRFEFLTSADGSEAPTERMRIASTGLVTIGTGGTFTTATGANDLAVAGDFEVEGQSRFDGIMGWGTAPVSSTIFTLTSSSATIVNGMDFDMTVSPGSGTLSAIVMNFVLVDEATHAGALTTVTGLNVRTSFHRTTLPASHTQKAINVQGYGVQSGTTIGSGTYDFYGLQITGNNGGANISGGTFTFTDIRGAADPSGYAAGATMRHYFFKAQADCWIVDNEPFFWGTGEDCDIRYDGTNWLFNVNVATTNIVWNEAGLDTNFRIESDNKSAMFFLDAGLDRIGIGDISSPASILEIEEQTTLTAGLGDGFSAMILLDPAYTGAFTVTRHNYLKCENVAVSGSAVVTDACTIWFDAAAGTHKALDAGTTKVSIGVVTAWEKKNVAGTVMFSPLYSSKTS